MPYPPPPGPPPVGEFQAIGLLPAPQLPDVTGHGGDFLETDGIIPQWEPVVGVLPDQSGHGGQFLSTDGALASWSAVPDPLPAQATHGGQFLTTDGATPSWATVNVLPNVFDIRNFGAQSATSYNRAQGVFDCSDAIEAAIAAWTVQNSGMQFGFTGPVGGVFIPAGYWYISRPIMPPAGCLIYGEGQQLSTLVAGCGLSGDGLVPGFSGPMIYIAGQTVDTHFYPTYVSPLVGVTGQALELKPTDIQTLFFPPSLIIEDCYPWSTYLALYAAELSLRCWVKVTTAWADTAHRWLIGTRGHDPADQRAVSLHVISNGATVQYVATLTTVLSGTQTITSSAFAVGSTAHNLEIDYNGSFFDFYVDGVNQGHLAATGKVYKRAWEQASIAQNDFFNVQPLGPPNGALDSIELADVARHTGVGGFTPPTSKYAADSHTLWLCNFDQGSAPTGWPFFLAQTAILTVDSIQATYVNPPTFGFALPQPSHGGLVPHYVRILGAAFGYLPNVAGNVIQDIQLYSRLSNSGIICWGASRTTFRRLSIWETASYGLQLIDGFSFYSRASEILVSSVGIGIHFYGAVEKSQTHACQIGLWGVAGRFTEHADQPEWNTFIPFIWGPLLDGYSSLDVEDCANDEEGAFPYQFTAAFMIGAIRPSFKNNVWDSTLGPAGIPAFIYSKALDVPSKHYHDAFFTAGTAPSISTYNKQLGLGPVICEECTFRYSEIVTDIADLVVIKNAQTTGSQHGLSTSDVLANNLAGTFTVMYGYTTGGATFSLPEPDGAYVVEVTPKSYVGSAPAAGSTQISSYTTATTGFEVTLGADPGGTCIITFSYVIIRIDRSASLYSYIPSIPSTVTNPMAGATGDWSLGVTLVPIGPAKALRFNDQNGTEFIAEAGTIPNEWSVNLVNGSTFEAGANGSLGVIDGFIGNGFLSFDSSVSADGKLYGIANPGPHNIAVGSQRNLKGLGGLYAYEELVDGGYSLPAQFVPGQPQPVITQQTPIHIGENVGGTGTLASCVLRNLKVDVDIRRVVTKEQDAGLQAGQTEAVFFGDAFTLGRVAGAAGLGGFATQIAEAKYATTYYWFAATSQMRAADALNTFWKLWGRNQTFVAAVVQLGFLDLLDDGKSATDTWTPINDIMAGTAATATFTPPTYNHRAWAGFVPPYRGVPGVPGDTATCVINGVSFLFTVTGTNTTLTDLATLRTAILASGPTTALVTPTVNTDSPGNPYLRIDAVLDGFAGNGISTSTDAAHGAYWYPGPATFDGANCTITIAGVIFDATFNTDASTSVNDLIARINLSAPTLALVTPSNTGTQLLLTAATIGSAGNSIAIDCNNIFGGSFVPIGSKLLTGGADGLIGSCPVIVVCTVPPFGDAPTYTAGKNTQRVSLNSTISAFAAAHGGDGVVLADVDVTVRLGADHTKIDPTYLATDNIYLNDAGHAALVALISPLLP